MIASVLRPAEPNDRNFLARGWASEMRRSAWARHVPNSEYWASQHALIDRLLGASSVIVACDPEDSNHLYGGIVHMPGALAIVHWLYVKGSHRKLGVARKLLSAAIGVLRPIYCTQAPEVFNDRGLVERYNLVYSPYLMLGIGPQPMAQETECSPPLPQDAPAL